MYIKFVSFSTKCLESNKLSQDDEILLINSLNLSGKHGLKKGNVSSLFLLMLHVHDMNVQMMLGLMYVVAVLFPF